MMWPRKGDRILLASGIRAYIRKRVRDAVYVSAFNCVGLIRLDYRDEGTSWARGWNTKAAQALLAASALR